MKTKACLVLSLGLVLFLLGGLTLNQKLHAQLKPTRAQPLSSLVMEEFIVQTDGSGEAQITLSHPLEGNLAGVFCHAEDRFIAMTEIAGSDLSIKIVKAAYAKAEAFTGSTPGNLPSGVTAASSLQGVAGMTSSPTGYGMYAQPGGGQYASAGHAHQFNASVPFLYVHHHDVVTSETAFPAAKNESGLRIVVLYKRL
ncbi:MAG: hypothetical protein ABIK28_19475 [Planctomycetota bacterium]